MRCGDRCQGHVCHQHCRPAAGVDHLEVIRAVERGRRAPLSPRPRGAGQHLPDPTFADPVIGAALTGRVGFAGRAVSRSVRPEMSIVDHTTTAEVMEQTSLVGDVDVSGRAG
jgi:hypothetical protein